jgi:Protein of unknown function (DUF3105)
MAQRKNPSPKPSPKPTGKASAPRPSSPSPSPTKSPGRPPAKKPGKSIVNQRQTPWGLIVTTVLIVVFAVIVVVVAVNSGSDNNDAGNPYTQPQLASTKSIKGLVYKAEPDHTHVTGTVQYDTTPPTGGNHADLWADCTGTVYPKAIANENAVHMLEHGAIWVTYREGLPASEVNTLKKVVEGQNYMAMSPFPNLKTKVSLQAWGYQLFVDSVTDPRIEDFVTELRHNKDITPEYGATCSQPGFITHPSTFGHPESAADLQNANTMENQ